MKETLCNLCGLSCHFDEEHDKSAYGLIDASVVGGYPSTPGNGRGALDDMVGYQFSLCEFCLDWLFSKFRLKVQTFDPMAGRVIQEGESLDEAIERTGGFVMLVERSTPKPWRPAEERVAQDEWRSMKEEFRAEKARRDAARGQ